MPFSLMVNCISRFYLCKRLIGPDNLCRLSLDDNLPLSYFFSISSLFVFPYLSALWIRPVTCIFFHETMRAVKSE